MKSLSTYVTENLNNVASAYLKVASILSKKDVDKKNIDKYRKELEAAAGSYVKVLDDLIAHYYEAPAFDFNYAEKSLKNIESKFKNINESKTRMIGLIFVKKKEYVKISVPEDKVDDVANFLSKTGWTEQLISDSGKEILDEEHDLKAKSFKLADIDYASLMK